MDKLDVIKLAEERGGTERRESLEQLMILARELRCEAQIGGGRAGGINFRYGLIGYAVLDVNTKGVVKLYVQPHPSKDASEEHIDALNGYIADHESLDPKSFPINSFGHLEDKIEDIPIETLEGYLEESIELIRANYYRQHIFTQRQQHAQE